MSSYGPISSVCPAARVSGGDGPEDAAGAGGEIIPAKYYGVLLRAGVATLSHPMEHAKLLIQLGYEPIAPRPKKTMFGNPALQLPSVFAYMGHMRRRDGFLAMYRGWAPKMAGMGLSAVVQQRMALFWPPVEPKDPDNPTPEEIVESTSRQVAERMACLIVTHPLHVCAVRTMAQFVGREDKYGSGVFGPIVAIYREDGILGYYAGFVPRALGELATIGLTAAAGYVINTYVLPDKTLRMYTDYLANFFASSLCYPFQVVGNCMAVSHSGLAASYPPHMPLYQNWVDCWTHLSKQKQLKRGSSLLFRYYTGPQVIVGDRAFPIH